MLCCATPGYSTIDRYSLTRTLPAANDGSHDLWLSSISRTGSGPRATV